MIVSKHLATHLRGVFFGGNWTSVNFKKQLADVSFEEANIKLKDLNTILGLTYHMGYYVTGVLEVFNNKPLSISDAFSYNYSKVSTPEDWKNLYSTILEDAEKLAKHIEVLNDDIIWSDFENSKYGNYFSNINGIIEHTHYHLGQIVLIKKILKAKT